MAGVALNCCIGGYSYDTDSGLCLNIADPSLPAAEPIPCACCPFGYTYINNVGQFVADDLTIKTIINPNASDFYDTCARIVNMTFAMPSPSPITPVGCPCCADGFTWVSDIQVCVDQLNTKNWVDPIPCLPCICAIPPSPPGCGSGCGTTGEGINYHFNPFVRQCEDCIADQASGQSPKGKIISFLPTNYTNPPINFKYNSKNYI